MPRALPSTDATSLCGYASERVRAKRNRQPLLDRLAELGSEHETVPDRIYTRDPDGFVLEFLFEELPDV